MAADGTFVADVRLEDTDEVLQLPIVKGRLKSMLESAVKNIASVGAPVIPSSDDSLEEFLMATGQFFGKDPTKWEEIGTPQKDVKEEAGKRYIQTTGQFAGTELHLFTEEPHYDSRLPVREDRPDLNFHIKQAQICTDDEWRMVMDDQPWTSSKRRQHIATYLLAKLEADDAELAEEGCHGFWELSINKDHHMDIHIDRLDALLAKINSPNVTVSTTAAAALWGFATSGGCRRCLADLDAVPVILAAINRTLKMQTIPDEAGGEESAEGGQAPSTVTESVRAKLQQFLLGAMAVMLVDRCCRRPYFALENNFHTLFTMCKPMPGYKDSDAQSRRETSAKILTSLIQRDVEARKLLVSSGALKSVLELLNPEGPGSSMVQFCMASLLATLVLDDETMELIRDLGEAPTLFESCLRLLVSVFGKLHEELDRRTNGFYKEGDTAVYDLYLGVRLAEASSQAMWGSAHYCVQTSPVQIVMEQIMSLGIMGRDCVATDQLPLSRVCHCVTATLATLASHPDTADLIMTCPDDLALATMLLLVEVFETEVFECAGHVKASACAGIAFLSCHPIGAEGDECMYGPYRTKLLEMGALGGLLRAALTSVMDEECDMVVQQAAAIGIMYLSTMAGALEPSELAMYSALLMDSDNSEMIEFLMAGMWILLRSPENRKVLGSSFQVNPASGMTSKMMTKLNDAITLHEIHDQAQEKAAILREEQAKIEATKTGSTRKNVPPASPGPGTPPKEGSQTSNKDNKEGHAGSRHSSQGPTTEPSHGAGGDVQQQGQDQGQEAPQQQEEQQHQQEGQDQQQEQGAQQQQQQQQQQEGMEGQQGGEPGSADGQTQGQQGEGQPQGEQEHPQGEGMQQQDQQQHEQQGSPPGEAHSHTSQEGRNSPPHEGDDNTQTEHGQPSFTADGTGSKASPPSTTPPGPAQSMHLDNVPPAQGLGAMSGGVGPDGENLPRGGGEEGGLRGPPSDRPSLKHQASMAAKGKLEQLDNRFNDSLKNNWGLETLVSVGESWMPAMLEQDSIGEATDVPVLKLFEFLVASICLFMIEDDVPPEPRQLDLFKLTGPSTMQKAARQTWWTIDARAPEPSSEVESQMERALAILTQLIGMKLLVAWKSLQLAVVTLWNACARNGNMERHVVERDVCSRLLDIANSPLWPPSLRDMAGGCLAFFMERYSNLRYMPSVPLPENCKWPKPTPPSDGLVASLLANITLINSRIPLLEYRGCHGIARLCFAAPYGATPEGGREYLREAKAAAAILGGVDAMISQIRRINKRYQDLLDGRRPGVRRLSSMFSQKSFHAHMQSVKHEDPDDSSAYERDMTTLEAQQDLYFMVFSALLNISVLKSAQPMVAKKGLLVLLGTSTLLYNRVATSGIPCENEEKLLHVVSGITQNLALHPGNRTRLYKAELHGSLALDKLVEHAMEGEDTGTTSGAKSTVSSTLPPISPPAATFRNKTGAPGSAASQPAPLWKTNNTGPQAGTARSSLANSTLNVSLDTALHAQQIRPKVVFPPIVENKEDVWQMRNKDVRAASRLATMSRSQARMRPTDQEQGGLVSFRDMSRHGSSVGGNSERMSTLDSPSSANLAMPQDSRTRFMSWVDSTFAGEGLEGSSSMAGGYSNALDAQKQTCRRALWDENGDWLDSEPESSKLLNKLLCRPLNHLWNDSPETRARHGQKRWEPAVSEYREGSPGVNMVRSAARLMQTAPPKGEAALMEAATQMMSSGAYDQMTASQRMGDFSMERPNTASRQQGRVALTVLNPDPESLLPGQSDMDAQFGGLDEAGGASSPDTKAKEKQRPLKIILGPQRSRQVISFEDRIITDEDSRPTLTLFEHVQGSRVCEGMFPSYQLPNGKMAYMYYNGGLLLDEVAVDAVQPPPRPSTVPQALQQAMPLADVLNLIAKPPGSAPPFIPYKPVPYLVPLPGKHTLPVKAPFKHSASAFGDLREDNLQLIIQAKRIIKTQTQMYVEDIEVKVVEEKEPWTLPMSIFKPRLKESDARNFFDTPAALEKMFERDWQRVCTKEKFTSMLAREHKGNKSTDKDEATMLKEVHDVLLEYYQTWYSAFIYFAAGGSGDPYHMSMNQFTACLDECHIPDPELPGIKRSDCDTIFIVCNFQPDKKSHEAQVNVENALMRYEFLESIVRAGIAKYGKGIATEDVAEAVRMILTQNIAPNLTPAGKHVANDFRTERLYTEEVDIVFKRHQVLLKAIYSRYRLKPAGGGLRTKMLKLEGWNQLMQDVHFLDSHYTIQDAILTFLWSRMFVIDEIKDYSRYTSLSFIDFLEALGRAADMKSLPEPEDLEAAGYSNILDWSFDKERMEGNPESAEQTKAIFRMRESGHLEAPKTRPLYVKVEQMLDLMFRRLYWDPSNPTMPFNYDGLLKLIKKLDKDMGP